MLIKLGKKEIRPFPLPFPRLGFSHLTSNNGGIIIFEFRRRDKYEQERKTDECRI